nr:O-antigen ligase family protein [Vagococcus proximus]
MIVTIINYFNKDLIINSLGFLLSNEQVDTIRFGQIWNGSSGLAGELSFNAFCLSIGFSIYFSRLLSNKKNVLLSIWYSIVLILFFISISMTSKRSMLIVIPLVSVIMILIYVYNQRNNILKFFTTMIIIVSPIFYKIFVLDKLTQLLQSGKGNSALSNRELYWNIALDMIKEKPILGHGINSYDIRFNMLRGHSGFAGAHNSFLQIFSELGLVGFLLFVTFILNNLYMTFKSLNYSIKEEMLENQLLLLISLFIQLICISVGVSESIFYQPQEMYMYGVACSIGYKIFLDINKRNRKKVPVLCES